MHRAEASAIGPSVVRLNIKLYCSASTESQKPQSIFEVLGQLGWLLGTKKRRLDPGLDLLSQQEQPVLEQQQQQQQQQHTRLI
jgi:hypothetical protein